MTSRSQQKPKRQLVRFGEKDATRAGFTSDDAEARFLCSRDLAGSWNAADGDFEVFLDLLLDGGGAIPMRESEAAVNFRLVGVFGSEEGVELLFGVDAYGVGISVFRGAGE